ncbi:Uncharacterized protein dnm_093420 [Desulfonema magnum]|uniref:Uncharacterized protein n=1 Tax=Desulfonema magnum TaxID=45655 RepID=A0A975BWV8_9BACT|nr:Uncharacterized protein dnm_093420 [Desulfonema magnum]
MSGTSNISFYPCSEFRSQAVFFRVPKGEIFVYVYFLTAKSCKSLKLFIRKKEEKKLCGLFWILLRKALFA